MYRPELEHGDKTFVMQRMTWDNEKGLVMISANDLNPMLGRSERVYIKGLDPDKKYWIDSQLGGMEPAEKTGREWMEEGVYLSCVKPGSTCSSTCRAVLVKAPVPLRPRPLFPCVSTQGVGWARMVWSSIGKPVTTTPLTSKWRKTAHSTPRSHWPFLF